MIRRLLQCVAMIAPIVAAGADQRCGALKPTDDARGYRWRGDRCEGKYQADVNAQDLRLASFSSLSSAFDPAGKASITLSWNSPATGNTSIAAIDLRDRSYYQMDASTGATSFVWSTDVLRSANITGRDLGIVAWTGSDMKRIYLPVAVNGSTRYRMLILPGTELTEVFISLYKMGPDGKKVGAIVQDQSLGAGYYPSRAAFAVDLPSIANAGFYYAEISATAREKASVSCGVFFYVGR
jgi:hypothetical protein